MLNSSARLWLGVAFVVIGAINVWLVLQVSAQVRDTTASTRLIAAHRIGGYFFIALFCVVGYSGQTSLVAAEKPRQTHARSDRLHMPPNSGADR
jgi:hypothetical protein